MRRVIGLVIALGLILTLFTLSVAEADEPVKPQGPVVGRLAPITVAVAIGLLKEPDDGAATVDLFAHKRADRLGGNLRFYSPDAGYYNGAVRQLVIENGVIKAAGAGVLVRPDGTRMRVRFTATFAQDGEKVTIAVKGVNGYEYSMDGRLDPGVVKAGSPQRRALPAEGQ